jgi:chromosome partitioning protein
MIRLTIGNQRGGVGKTTTAVTLARLWAEKNGIRTLLVDADPQGSIGTILRVKPELFLNDFLWNKRRLADCVVQPIPNLDVLCSNRDTLEAEQRAIGTIGREAHLRKHLPAG